MKINALYNKHAKKLENAAREGRPFAVFTYGPDCSNARYRTFAEKEAASAFLKAAKPNGQGGMIAETDAERGGLKALYVPPVTGFGSFG